MVAKNTNWTQSQLRQMLEQLEQRNNDDAQLGRYSDETTQPIDWHELSASDPFKD